MNGRNVLILITLSLAISVALYYQETAKQQHEIDAVKNGISGVEPFFKSGTHISYRGEPSKIELYMWPRYILASRFISYNEQADTVLSIQYLHNGDSALNAFIAGRNILFEKTDSQYRYLITAKPTRDTGR